MTKYIAKAHPLELQSKLAKKAWKADELRLPKPVLTKKMTPSDYLLEICQYARGANSRGEWLFREKYLKPWLAKFVGAPSVVEDDMGNIIVQVGTGDEPWDTLHVGHIDSVHPDEGNPFQAVELSKDAKTEVIELRLAPWIKQSVPEIKTGIRFINGVQTDYHYTGYTTPAAPQRCLGADDGCAVALMLFLISKGVKGTYLFTRGEEIGCKGTHFMIQEMPDFFKKFKRSIEVDRKGTDEIIYKMSVGNTASMVFAIALGNALDMGHKPSDRGSITDVGHIAKLIPENVNLAAGYWQQHGASEHCVPAYLNRLAVKMVEMDWDALPTEREAGKFHVVVKQPPVHRSHGNSTAQYQPHGGYYSGGNAVGRNVWGDWSTSDLACTIPFEDKFTTEQAAKYFIRENVGLIWEFLNAMNLSVAEIEAIATNGTDEDLIEDDDEFQLLLADLEDLIEEEEDEVEIIEGKTEIIKDDKQTALTVVENTATH